MEPLFLPTQEGLTFNSGLMHHESIPDSLLKTGGRAVIQRTAVDVEPMMVSSAVDTIDMNDQSTEGSTQHWTQPVFDTVQAEVQVQETPSASSTLDSLSKQPEKAKGKKWLRRAALGAAGAALAVGATVGFANDESGAQLRETIEAVPSVVAGYAAGEVLWIGGAGIAVAGAALAAKRRGKTVTIDAKNIKDSFSSLKEASLDTFARRDVQAGIAINTLGATASVASLLVGTLSLPPEAWPAGLSLTAFDAAVTFGARAPLAYGIKKARSNPDVMAAEMQRREEERIPQVDIRKIEQRDIRRLAEIDRDIFAGAYGDEMPTVEELEDRFTRRMHNTDLWYVVEIDGEVEGSIAAMRTNKPPEKFESWEDSTNDGTFEGKTDPDGQYLYVANLGVTPKCTAADATDILVAKLMAEATRDNRIKSGYLESRMPGLKKWLERNGGIPQDPEALEAKVMEYAETRSRDGQRIDPLLRKYEGLGCTMERVYSGAYKDSDSLNYGVLFTANVLGPKSLRENKLARIAIGTAVATAVAHPKAILATVKVAETTKKLFKKSSPKAKSAKKPEEAKVLAEQVA